MEPDFDAADCYYELVAIRKILERQAPSAPAYYAIPDEVISFLLGEGPLDGVWFGEEHSTEGGSYWWRKHLRNKQPINYAPDNY